MMHHHQSCLVILCNMFADIVDMFGDIVNTFDDIATRCINNVHLVYGINQSIIMYVCMYIEHAASTAVPCAKSGSHRTGEKHDA